MTAAAKARAHERPVRDPDQSPVATAGRAPASARPGGAQQQLLDAMTEVCARDGYASVTVERVLAAARVSRATFYQYFSNLEDCFVSAYRTHALALVGNVASAAAAEPGELALLDVLVNLARYRPTVALLLWREGLAGGPPALRERQALIAGLEEALAASPRSNEVIDLPIAVLVGGIFRFLSMRLANGQVTDALAEEIREWARAFASPLRASWSSRLAPALPDDRSQANAWSISPARSKPARERLLTATAAVILAKGYRAATVADIVAVAGVSRRSFYDQFATKRDAFVATYEQAFAKAIAACAPAFFSSRSWPQSVWDSALAFTRFFAARPAFAQLGFVECYALGPSFLDRVHDTQLAFTLFLEEGYRQSPAAESLPRACSGLTATAIFEAGFQACRCGPGLYMRRTQPLVVYIALAPFIGADQAGEFVGDALRAGDSVPAQSP